MTTSLSPRGGQAGSPGSESRNKPKDNGKKRHHARFSCWLEDAGSHGNGMRKQQAGVPG